MESFQRSFNQTIGLNPAFMMLFPLTLIKNTELDYHASDYGIKQYTENEIESLDLLCDIEFSNVALFEAFSLDDLIRFDNIALFCFYFFNRFRYCLDHMERRAEGRTAWLYETIGAMVKSFLRSIGQVPSNTNRIVELKDELTRIFTEILQLCGAGEIELTAFQELFKLDMLRILILESPLREKYFTHVLRLHKKGKESTPPDLSESRFFKSTHGKAVTLEFPLTDLLELSVLKEQIEKQTQTVYIHAPYTRWNTTVRHLLPLEEFLIERISSERPVRYGSLQLAVQRKFKEVDTEALTGVLHAMNDEGIIDIVSGGR